MNNDFIELSNGLKMPDFAIGSSSSDNALMVELSIKYGLRFFDTAYMYNSESDFGAAFEKCINEGLIKREDLFIQSKAPHNKIGYNSTLVEFENSLKKLKCDYLDSYLIHYPHREHENWRELTLDKWRALETLYKQGKVKAIGVSNFLPHHLDFIMQNAEIKPMINQIELNPLRHQNYTIEYCRAHNIAVQAWAPLGSGRCFYNPIIKQLANKYHTSVLSFVLNWHQQKGYIPILGVNSEEEIVEVSHRVQFNISDEDMLILDDLKENSSGCHTDSVLVDWIPEIPQKKLVQESPFTSKKIVFKLFGFLPIFRVEEVSPDKKKFYFLNLLLLKTQPKPLLNCRKWKKSEKISGKYKIEQVFNDQNNFLECPVWDKKNNIIYCVASSDSKIYKVDVKKQTFEVIPTTKGVIGSIDILPDGWLISAEEHGIFKINPQTQERIYLTQLKPENKYVYGQGMFTYNDGKLDARGRFVVGTSSRYNNNKLYSFDGKSQRVLEHNIGLSNGIAWNKDNTVMYYVDSDTKKVAKYHYNIETGDAFFDSYVIEFTQGTPDGICMDENDNLWIAEFDGQRVSKWNTEDYTKVDEINFPVYVTSCCLAGKNNEYLYVTTCKAINSEKSSGLFRIKIK